MGIFVNFILLTVFWFIGNLLCSYGVIAPLIVIRTALPITKHLCKQGLISEYNARMANKQSAFTICFWLILDIVAVVLLCLYANTYVWVGFAIGFVLSFFLGIGRTGPITDNIADYVNSYNRFLPSENMEEIIKELYIYQQLGHLY